MGDDKQLEARGKFQALKTKKNTSKVDLNAAHALWIATESLYLRYSECRRD
jgi:hypothetical protein